MRSDVQNKTTSLVFGCLLLFGCHSSHAQENDAIKSPATIVGLVRCADGVLVNRAAAHLHRWDSDRQRWRTFEQSVPVGSDGAFQFKSVPGDEYWCVDVRAPEAGIVFRQFVAESGQTKTVNVTLSPPSAAYITVRSKKVPATENNLQLNLMRLSFKRSSTNGEHTRSSAVTSQMATSRIW